ncbi:Anthranilate phosphoribosyltransferase [Candidatus Terasakiella magnetica]|uniref:Anthranilate phosphoribosyltransferase n=1 Tax=Candidatus Terasakiella magnetica TaxID=1867952 RepID=A0A1C3RCP3_9PROT|nr:anthranilate phosphoribosyltransferase [Candidatus Terasakiella magnetica]SCA55046.1 Anthranilate phosphoribosyltransferase [Candidatus Terasakiella magnetica]
MSDAMKPTIAKVADGQALSQDEAKAAFDLIMTGEATQAQIGAFLMALRVRGETVDEITAAATTMREQMNKVSAPADAIDIVGTGGDAKGTLNISTATALVVAGCGLFVAKHGNKALSSKSGAADVLSCLGVNMQAEIPVVEKAIAQAGIGFMMAPLYHSAMRFVGGPRVEMGTRTVFNLLGPISNPAGVKRQMTGVFAKEWVRPLAEVLGRLGSEKVWVVHGSDGMDELTTTGSSFVAEYANGTVREFEINPADYGITLAQEDDLKGGDGEYNAAAIHRLLDGEKGAYRDVVLLNAAASLMVADKVESIEAGMELAAQSIDSGKAKDVLQKLVTITNEG